MVYMNGMVKSMKVTGKKVNNMVKDISQMYKVKKKKGLWNLGKRIQWLDEN